ncbi:putative ATP-binding cassette transporter [Chitinophaga eiseniae]|uniref:Putative ATP-binding cassette transporter n=1 Tax=Chitinophaga eiseniae TaxID=634771 RepID=A0A1T4U6T5_9BACT|nr:cyclic peptide export ABC transporter [Chitinophaga eiseniae]SKA48310.1 putative ATP-binding cassette transporter [Chitinophaga eiseniae]
MKKLMRLTLQHTGPGRLMLYTLLGILSGISSFLFISLVNKAVGLLLDETFTENQLVFCAGFLLTVGLFVGLKFLLARSIIRMSQETLWSLRNDILSSVLKAGYQQLNAHRIRIRSALLNDVYTLTDASMSVIGFSTSLILSVACLLYLLSISWSLFLITLLVAAGGIVLYRWNTNKTLGHFKNARVLEDNFVRECDDILDGFREIYLEPAKGRVVYRRISVDIAGKSIASNTIAYRGFVNNQMTGQVLFYILIAAVLLFLGKALHISLADTISFIFTLLYLVGALETIMVMLPVLARASVAAGSIIELREFMSDTSSDTEEKTILPARAEAVPFSCLGLQHVVFSYPHNENIFRVGPVRIEINRGDIVFIHGGNGSGKTTLLYLMLGLYVPDAGELTLNNEPVDRDNYAAYRNNFSAVFSDFYLFNNISGWPGMNLERWEEYLHLFELEGKVKLEGSCFSTTDLSTGQRKRLALIVGLMEGKPILMLDEWAADQDPYFRKKFYMEILPQLKADGFTIIAITHDDKYYHCADYIYKMEHGRLINETVGVAQH